MGTTHCVGYRLRRSQWPQPSSSPALWARAARRRARRKRVGVIICTNQNPFCAAWAKTVKSGLEKQGARVTVLTSVFDPAVDAQNMNRLIADKPDLIISVPASASAIVPSYVRAQRAGIKVLGAIGRQSPTERSSSPPKRAPTTVRSDASPV